MGIFLEDTYQEEMEILVGKMVLLLLYAEENIRGGWGIEYVRTAGLIHALIC